MRKRQIKRAAALGIVLAAGMAFGAQAGELKRIGSISLQFEGEIRPGDSFGDEDMEITASGSKYTVEGYEILNGGFVWESYMEPVLRVTLSASEGYYFPYLDRDQVRLKGEGALYRRGSAGRGGDAYTLEVVLDSLDHYLGELSGVSLGADGVASWNEAEGAGSYEVRVFRDGEFVGGAGETKETRMSCWEKLSRAGTYQVQVRAVNQADPDIKGPWVQSPPLAVDAAMAAGFQGRPAVQADGSVVHARWRQSADGRWWYDNGDGTWPAGEWKEIQGKRYFFDEQGYMKTGWFLWEGRWYYCTETGYMLKDCITQDGYWLGLDGAMIEQEPCG